MKHATKQPQLGATDSVKQSAKEWWERHPEANILDIQSAIEQITQSPPGKEHAAPKVKKGLFKR